MKFFLVALLLMCNPSTDFNSLIEGKWKCWKTEIDNSTTSIFGGEYSIDYLIEFKAGKFYDHILGSVSNYIIEDSFVIFNGVKGYKILKVDTNELVLFRLGNMDPERTTTKRKWIHYFRKEEM